MPPMEAQVAVAKTRKYATSESGDSLEMIERPTGGLSLVLADGQTSGKAAKAIAGIVLRKAISLLADRLPPPAPPPPRPPSVSLSPPGSGKGLPPLTILSIDLPSQSLVAPRNSPAPVYLIEPGDL